jgi:hypothetical protein
MDAKAHRIALFDSTGFSAFLSREIPDILTDGYHSQPLLRLRDLRTETIWTLEGHEFPAVVAYDCYGNSVYEQGGTPK